MERCLNCKRRGIIIKCRCEVNMCIKCITIHNCTYDFKKMKTNVEPVIGTKIDKI